MGENRELGRAKVRPGVPRKNPGERVGREGEVDETDGSSSFGSCAGTLAGHLHGSRRGCEAQQHVPVSGPALESAAESLCLAKILQRWPKLSCSSRRTWLSISPTTKRSIWLYAN